MQDQSPWRAPDAPPRAAPFHVAVAQGVRFYSRVPVPRLAGETDPHAIPDFSTLPRALPLAALVIVAPAATTLMLGAIAGLPPFASAALVVAILVLTTGAFHEDGLADVADGFGGGATAARKLEIMKDSRVGAFGATAIALSLLLRVAAITGLIESRASGSVVAILVATAVLSRLAGLLPLAMLAPARQAGASAQVGRPTPASLIAAFAIAAAILGAAAALAAWPWALGPAMFVAAMVGGLAMTWLSARQIGGQTGDVAGAAQQIAEIACLFTPLAAALKG